MPLDHLERVRPPGVAHGPGNERAVDAGQQRLELGARVGREHLVVLADQGPGLLRVQAALAYRDGRRQAYPPRVPGEAVHGRPAGQRDGDHHHRDGQPDHGQRRGQPPGQRVPGAEDEGRRKVDEQAQPGDQGQVTTWRARLHGGDRRDQARPPGRDDGGDRHGEYSAAGDQCQPCAGQRSQADRRAVRRPHELRRGQDPRRGQPEYGSGRAQRGLLGEQHPHHLTGGEPERLQHRDVLALHQDPGRGDVGDCARAGDQRDDAEQGQQQPEQPVVAGHRALHLLPGRVAQDRRVLRRAVVVVVDVLHDLAGGQGGVVVQPQTHDLLGLARLRLDPGQQRVLDPDQAGRPLRVETLVGGVGDADDPDRDLRAVDAVHDDLVTDADVDGRRERRLKHRAVLLRGPQPGARHDQRRGHRGRHRGQAGQFDR